MMARIFFHLVAKYRILLTEMYPCLGQEQHFQWKTDLALKYTCYDPVIKFGERFGEELKTFYDTGALGEPDPNETDANSFMNLDIDQVYRHGVYRGRISLSDRLNEDYHKDLAPPDMLGATESKIVYPPVDNNDEIESISSNKENASIASNTQDDLSDVDNDSTKSGYISKPGAVSVDGHNPTESVIEILESSDISNTELDNLDSDEETHEEIDTSNIHNYPSISRRKYDNRSKVIEDSSDDSTSGEEKNNDKSISRNTEMSSMVPKNVSSHKLITVQHPKSKSNIADHKTQSSPFNDSRKSIQGTGKQISGLKDPPTRSYSSESRNGTFTSKSGYASSYKYQISKYISPVTVEIRVRNNSHHFKTTSSSKRIKEKIRNDSKHRINTLVQGNLLRFALDENRVGVICETSNQTKYGSVQCLPYIENAVLPISDLSDKTLDSLFYWKIALTKCNIDVLVTIETLRDIAQRNGKSVTTEPSTNKNLPFFPLKLFPRYYQSDYSSELKRVAPSKDSNNNSSKKRCSNIQR